MKEYNINSVIRGTIWGVLAGGTFGFFLGVLSAPDAGSKTRRRLAFQLDRFAHNLGEFIERIGRSEVPSDARRTGDALIEDARLQAEQILSDADALLDEVKRYRKGRR